MHLVHNFQNMCQFSVSSKLRYLKSFENLPPWRLLFKSNNAGPYVKLSKVTVNKGLKINVADCAR